MPQEASRTLMMAQRFLVCRYEKVDKLLLWQWLKQRWQPWDCGVECPSSRAGLTWARVQLLLPESWSVCMCSQNLCPLEASLVPHAGSFWPQASGQSSSSFLPSSLPTLSCLSLSTDHSRRLAGKRTCFPAHLWLTQNLRLSLWEEILDWEMGPHFDLPQV